MVLPIRNNKEDGTPIYVQLAERIRLLIREGVLRTGDAMPTVRSLAVELGVNANTVARVYHELQADGLLRLEQGVGTFVAEVSDSQARLSDFKQLDKKVAALIRLARQVGMGPAELSQFIQVRGQEVTDVSSEP